MAAVAYYQPEIALLETYPLPIDIHSLVHLSILPIILIFPAPIDIHSSFTFIFIELLIIII